MKIFVSIPMANRTENDIKAEFERISELYDNAEIIDSFIDEDKPQDANILWYLGVSLTLMSQADMVYFCKGWENARGCKIEYMCAEKYGLKIVEEKAGREEEE